MSTDQRAPYLFCIDTEDYAGNFERPLCAYVTGRVGECGVGDDMALLFKETGHKAFDNVIDEPDEHGCHRPVSIYPTPGWFNNGLGGHYKDTPANEVKALKDHIRDDVAYRKGSLEHARIGLKQAKPDETREGYRAQDWERGIVQYEREIAKAKTLTKLTKYPACLSVAISFYTKPTKTQLDLMKKRAAEFAALPAKYDRKGTLISRITGFRLIEQKHTTKTKSLVV